MKLGHTDDAIAVYKRILKQDENNRLRSPRSVMRNGPRDATRKQRNIFCAWRRLIQSSMFPISRSETFTPRGGNSPRHKPPTHKGRELAPHNALIVAGGINAGIEAHDMKLASAWMARVEPDMVREPQVLREQERYLSFKGDYQQSAQVGEQAIKVMPRDRDVVVYLGYDYLFLQKYEDLLALTSRYMNVLPKEPDIPLLAGYVYKHNGQSELAEQAFSEAIKRDPQVETAYVNRGYMLNDLHEPESAAADFETALKMQPGDGQAHLGLAYSSLDLHRNAVASAPGRPG